MSPYLNDGSNDAPKLRIWLNLDNLADLRPGSLWPAGLETRPPSAMPASRPMASKACRSPTPAPHQVTCCHTAGLDRISVPDDADPVFAKHVDRGDLCLTVHAGWGWEDDLKAGRLVEAVLNASQRHQLPVFVETHRATLTHGRIASSGCMQAGIDTDWNARPALAYGHADYLTHFRDLWTRAMRGFLQSAGPGDVLVFAPELLSGAYYYARMFLDSEGTLVEEHDRYAQALIYQNLARECFAAEKLTEAQSLT